MLPSIADHISTFFKTFTNLKITIYIIKQVALNKSSFLLKIISLQNTQTLQLNKK
jgi:hypothetical protein